MVNGCSENAIIRVNNSVAEDDLTRLKGIKKNGVGAYIIDGERVHGASIRGNQNPFETILKGLQIPHKGFYFLWHIFATRFLGC